MTSGHTRAAVADHPVRRNVAKRRSEPFAKLGDRGEPISFIELRSPVEIECTGNVSGDGIEGLDSSGVALWRARIDEAPVGIGAQGIHGLGVDARPRRDRAWVRGGGLPTRLAGFDWRGGLWILVISGSVAAFAILVWDKATGLSSEEYRDIGILKAVGWKTADVMELKAAEGLVISIVSVLTGLILAEVHLVVFNGAVFAPIVRGWSVLYPSFDVSPRLGAYGLLASVPLAVLPYVAASLVPAWRASVTDPDSVLRS